jgi:hypothetical protein
MCNIEVKVFDSRDLFYICVTYNKKNFASENNIASILEIPLVKYIQILESWGATDNHDNNGYFFKNKEHAYMAVRDLEPYVLMKKLI